MTPKPKGEEISFKKLPESVQKEIPEHAGKRLIIVSVEPYRVCYADPPYTQVYPRPKPVK